MKRHLWLMALALLASACGGKKKSGASGSGSGSGSGSASQEPHFTLGELFPAGKPNLPTNYAAGRFGMSKQAFFAALPALQGDEYLKAGEFSFFAYFDDSDHLTSVRVGVPADALAGLKAAWGEPLMTENSLKKQIPLWLNPDLTLKVMLEPTSDGGQSLAFSQYTPVKTLVGDGKDKFGFEKTPMLGKTSAELKADYPTEMQQDTEMLSFLHFPATEYDERFQVEATRTDGKVSRLQFWLHHGNNDKIKADMRALLVAKLGEPQETTANEGTPYAKKQLTFTGQGFTAVLGETERAWVIETAPAAAPAP